MASTPDFYLKPRRLEPGQTLGIVAPASCLDDRERIEAALETIASLGFQVKPAPHLFEHAGYLAGVDRDRAADLNAMFADETVAGIVALRGGYGSSRLLPLLDYDLIRRNPKVLLGYSDITALLNGIHRRTGLVTFHGPVANQAFTPYTLTELRKVLVDPAPPLRLGAPPEVDYPPGQVERRNRLSRLVGGRARGRLVGGNLTLMAHLAGTPYFPDCRGALLVLEDIQEAVYRVDRMLTQLWLAGQLQQIAGLVLGKFTDCEPGSSGAYQFALGDVLREQASRLGVPAAWGFMIGHVEDQTTWPVGGLAELDADAGTLTLLESPVV